MIIRYANGITLEGVLLSQSEGMLRVAVRGVDDAMVFHRVRGAWIAESCEQVQIELKWQCLPGLVVPDRSEVARLVRALWAVAPAETEGEPYSMPARFDELDLTYRVN